jgi:hypothetical protein
VKYPVINEPASELLLRQGCLERPASDPRLEGQGTLIRKPTEPKWGTPGDDTVPEIGRVRIHVEGTARGERVWSTRRRQAERRKRWKR